MRDFDRELRIAAEKVAGTWEGSGGFPSWLFERIDNLRIALNSVKGKPTALEAVTRIDGAGVALLNREEGHKATRAEMTKIMRELWDGSPAPQGCVWPWELAERAKREAELKGST